MIRKNILYFTRTMDLGGTEKVILQLCKTFKKDFNKIVVCSNGGIHEKELEKMGIKHYKINDIENKSILNIIKTLIRLRKIIKYENISIVHTHHRMAAFYISILKRILKIKFIHTAHNTFTDKKLLTKIALGSANIVAVGKKVKENLCDFYNLNSEKIQVIYNGIERDTNKIVEVDEIKKYKEKGYFIVGNIGRLSKQKGMEYYIKAIPDIIKINNKIMFFIIGDGQEKSKLKKLVYDLKIQNNIIFLGYRNDVINVIKQLDLVVLSSLWEGLPLTPIESFSAGKTIVATDVDGTGEIVINNKNGFLVERKNYNDISKKIVELYKNKHLRLSFEKEAYKTYKNKFSMGKFINGYLLFYESVMKGF